jgi:serine phosphatase RsbU (regulator of sigma subunit)
MNKEEQMFDYGRVKSSFTKLALCQPDEIINSLVKSGDDWMNGAVQSDDISFIVIKVK